MIDISVRMRRKSANITFIIFLLFMSLTTVGQQSAGELEQLLQTAIKSKDNGKASFYAFELARRYVEEQHPEKASPYLVQSISYAKKSGDKVLLYLGYDRMGQLLSSQKNYDKALENYQNALEISEELKKSEYMLD